MGLCDRDPAAPVEPDEALAALKRLLDSLDPDATGRLVKNLAEDIVYMVRAQDVRHRPLPVPPAN